MNDKTILIIERVFLTIIGIIFMASGIFTFFDPHTMGEALGIMPINASGETEIRATYGGLVVRFWVAGAGGFILPVDGCRSARGHLLRGRWSDVHPDSHSGHGRVHHQPRDRRRVRTDHGRSCFSAA